MARVFYGSAIQGTCNRKERGAVNRLLLQGIKEQGFEVVSEHTAGRSIEETAALLERSLGPVPVERNKRTVFIRDKMIEFVEGDISAAVFEVSTPSLGTGIEIAHAYLRPRMGLPQIPILALYQKGYWPNKLSSMISGITQEAVPNFQLREYSDVQGAKNYIQDFLGELKQP